MRCRAIVCLFVAVLLLMGSCCKKRPSAEKKLPAGYGVLELFVRDEAGTPVPDAQIRIENKTRQATMVTTDSEGKSRGAGVVAEGPFQLTIQANGYVVQNRGSINLIDGQTTSILVRLQKTPDDACAQKP